MLIVLIILYVAFAVSGSTLIKLGGLGKYKALLKVPVLNFNMSFVTLVGLVCYGISFLVYVVLLNKYDLSFISPLTVALVYILLMISAFIIFNEPINAEKIIGSVFILIGIILMLISSK